MRNLVALGLAVGMGGGLGLVAQQRMPPKAPALAGVWGSWLREDAQYIITGQERQSFKKLKSDEERREFSEQFWRRRDPTPWTQKNEFKDEHYRRIAYVDELYSTVLAGSKTDRGMIYIKYGPPDEIESHPAGGGEISTYPFEVWRYRFIQGMGTGVEIEFVDSLKNGDYHIALDPDEKEDALWVPGTGLRKSMDPPTTKTDGPQHGQLGPNDPSGMVEIIEPEAIPPTKPATVQYKDLAAVMDSGVRYNTLPMQVRADYFRVTHASIGADVMVQLRNSDLQYATTGKIAESHVRIFGRVTDVQGRVVDWFEDELNQEMMAAALGEKRAQPEVYLKRLLLRPGVYRLNLVAEDSEAHTWNTFAMALNVPSYDADTLSMSSLILAEQLERVTATGVDADPFVIRSSMVRPRVDSVFQPSETMGIYAEFYNFGFDETTRKPKGTVEYQIVRGTDGSVQADSTEDLSDVKAFPNASAFLVTVEKKYPLQGLTPGRYVLRMKVDDQVKQKTVTSSAAFAVGVAAGNSGLAVS